MIRLYTRLRSNIETTLSDIRETDYDFIRLHIGTNSLSLVLVLLICLITAYKIDILNWSYLRGISNDLSFVIGLFSIILGVGFYNFWQLGKKSLYTLHYTKTKYMPEGVNILFTYKSFSFAISNKTKVKANTAELPSTVRQALSISIFLIFAITVLDNGEFDKLKKFPAEILQAEGKFCPNSEDAIDAPPKEGCELIIRAYKLGYAKDLGICEPKKIDPEKLEVCQLRREDEPYLHYMSRLLLSSIDSQIAFFKNNKAKEIEDKFKLQLKELEVLKDYQRYAISAAPRASHHIWTNLPYPENRFIEKYRKYFKPSYCIEQFQNQTNTVLLEKDDQRRDSKTLEHVYGQLLFNPKSRDSVAFCKEYKIHWNSKPDTCKRFAKNPKAVLRESKVLSEVELVLKRHDIANSILSLDEEIKKIESAAVSAKNNKLNDKNKDKKSAKNIKNKIVKGKIAKDKQQIRKKNELVSFQCFMQTNGNSKKSRQNKVKLDNTKFLVRTRYFPKIESEGGTQISMYNEFSKVLENRFHYSKLKSRSDINVELSHTQSQDDAELLQSPSYLFTRLEKLKNVDIFLDNKWVLERDGLLDIYPYHVHLQNYVKSFRSEYSENHGRL